MTRRTQENVQQRGKPAENVTAASIIYGTECAGRETPRGAPADLHLPVGCSGHHAPGQFITENKGILNLK